VRARNRDGSPRDVEHEVFRHSGNRIRSGCSGPAVDVAPGLQGSINGERVEHLPSRKGPAARLVEAPVPWRGARAAAVRGDA
jgi:hypothetical protein